LALLLAEKKINPPLPPPGPPPIKLAWKVQSPMPKYTLHTKYRLKKKPPFQPPNPKPKT